MKKQLFTLSETISLIEQKRHLVITADESLLKKLPKGNWIAGTSPYFMTVDGGHHTKDKLFVDDFTAYGVEFQYYKYSKDNIFEITENSFDNGFIFLILPMASNVLERFGTDSLHFKNIFKNPIVGYVAGIDLQNKDNPSPKVYLGTTLEELSDFGVSMHVQLPENQVARVEIINPNSIDLQSPTFTFPKTSFSQSSCIIDGKKSNIADYLISIQHPTMGIPLISSNNGALINRDVKTIDAQNKTVDFYSPVFSDEVYRLAKPVSDYTALFNEKLSVNKEVVIYSCLCVSFYLLGNLEKKSVGIDGAFTFGEIAYQILNQTSVFLCLDKFEF